MPEEQTDWRSVMPELALDDYTGPTLPDPDSCEGMGVPDLDTWHGMAFALRWLSRNVHRWTPPGWSRVGADLRELLLARLGVRWQSVVDLWLVDATTDGCRLAVARACAEVDRA